MSGLDIKIFFWYVEEGLAKEIVNTLQKDNYVTDFKIFKDVKNLNEQLQSSSADLIVADFDLPEVLRDSIEKYHLKHIFHIPFIYLVGEKNEKKAAETLKRGVWDYIIKGNMVKLAPTVYSSQKYGKVLKRNKQMEDSVQQSRDQFKNLAENSPDIIMRFDRDLRHLFVNQSVFNQIGISAEALVDKRHRDLDVFPEKLVSFWEESLGLVLTTGKPNMVEFDLQTEKGIKSFEWRIFPEFNEDGQVLSLLTNARDITESRKSERALRLSEERLKLAVEATSLGYWDWDIETNDVFYSRIYFEMLGFEPDELPQVLDTWKKLLHPADREKAISYVEKSIFGKDKSFETEFRLTCKNGSYKWIYSRGRVIYTNEEGKPLRIIGSHEDISERKRNELIHQTLFQISNAVNTTKNMDELYLKIQESLGHIVDTKNCFLALYNEKTGLLNLPFLRDENDEFNDFPPGKTLTGYVLKTGKVQLIDAEREQKLMEEGLIEPVGTPCVSWLGVPLKIHHKTIGVFAIQSYADNVFYTEDDVIVLEFVSEQIALAIERKRSQDFLKESQEMQRRIFEASPDPIIVVNKRGQMIDYNSKLLSALGISNSKIVRISIFRFIERSEWRKAIDSFQYAWKEGYLSNLEFKVLKENGEKFQSEISAGTIFNDSGQPESMVIIIKDITERKEAEKRLKAAKEKAEESDRLKTAFLSNMSHEIRTPMNAIVGFSDLLKEQELSPEDRMEFITQINQGADTLMHLIDDIIDISKIEAEQLKICLNNIEIHNLMNEQVVMFRQNIIGMDKPQIELRLSWNWHEEQLILRTDQYRLIQVISNLLNNAIKFTESGYVELGMESINGYIRFYVKDTGIGISKEKQAVIFERFMQGHSSKERLYGGTGLGLAISKNLVNLLGGNIGVDSELGRGSEFWFTIPAKIIDGKPDAPVFSKRNNNLDWSGKKILIAEDDFANYKYLSEGLRNTNAELLWAKNGLEAFEMFKHQTDSIDLVLMDIRMPEMDGYECTRQIKKISPQTPVIAQTAHAMADEMQISTANGCDGHISKPISLDKLIRLIGSYINNS